MVSVTIVGGSGYSGGELVRLLLDHPDADIRQVTSERFAGKPVIRAHPNLRKRTDLKFSTIDDLVSCDLLFLCLPHGHAMNHIERYLGLAPRLIDLSGDFRLSDPAQFEKWYGTPHACPERDGYYFPYRHSRAGLGFGAGTRGSTRRIAPGRGESGHRSIRPVFRQTFPSGLAASSRAFSRLRTRSRAR